MDKKKLLYELELLAFSYSTNAEFLIGLQNLNAAYNRLLMIEGCIKNPVKINITEGNDA